MEIERKFLIEEPKDIPFELEEHTGEYIQQGYLAVTGKIEIRLRQQGEKAALTCKNIGRTNREEYELMLSEQQFQTLWPMTSDARIEKTRLVLPLGEDLEVELAIFAGRLTGLMLAEVESTTEQRCRSFLGLVREAADITGGAAQERVHIEIERGESLVKRQECAGHSQRDLH